MNPKLRLLLLLALFAGCLLSMPQPAFGAPIAPQTVTLADEPATGEALADNTGEETPRLSSSTFIRFLQNNWIDQSFLHRLYFVFYIFTPFVILAISLYLFLRKRWDNTRLLFALGLFEFLFGISKAGLRHGVFPWFCDYPIVGWIVTILSFAYLLLLLYTQLLMLRHFIAELSDNRLARIGWLVLYAALSVALTYALSTNGRYWLAPVAVVALWFFTRRFLIRNNATAWRFIGYTGVVFGGIIMFFLQTIGAILIAFLLIFLVRGFGESQGSGLPMTDTPAPDDGMLERAADGTPFVRHSDGTSTQLRDLGNGDFQDFNGNPWHDNGDGYMHR